LADSSVVDWPSAVDPKVRDAVNSGVVPPSTDEPLGCSVVPLSVVDPLDCSDSDVPSPAEMLGLEPVGPTVVSF
jgi:hypothetical protein